MGGKLTRHTIPLLPVAEGRGSPEPERSHRCRDSAVLIIIVLCASSIAVVALLEHSLVREQIAALGTSDTRRWISKLVAFAIFMVTYFGVAIGRLPGFKLDRAGAAFVGASLMVAVGILPLPAAYRAIDFDTIALLLGVMIVVAHLKLSGCLSFASRAIVNRARHPLTLLVAIVAVSGLLSAFLVNDTICLAMTPLVLDAVIQTNRNPIPYMLAIAMASNIGSAATITGNPQNMIIGGLSQISYGRFAQALSPVAAIGLLLAVVMITLAYRSEFWNWDQLAEGLPDVPASKPLMIKSAATSLAMVIAFFAGVVPARAAIACGAVLLLSRRIDCQQVYREIQWTLLLLFAGLFIVVAGLENNVLSSRALNVVEGLHLEHIPILSIVTAVLSNLVSNVPAVLALKPFVASMRDQQKVWLAIAMSSTLAGNFTILGSVANLIVVQSAETRGVRIRFSDYFRVGAPLTVMTVALGIYWL